MLLSPFEQQTSWLLKTTSVTIVSNTATGVTSPFKAVFIIRGIGHKVALVTKTEGQVFQLNEFFSRRYLLVRVGYSYSVYLPVPNYIGIKVGKKDRKLTIYGFSNDHVATFAKSIYALRPPSIYTGRGIRYKGLVPRRKLGKKDIRKGRFF